MGLKSGYKHTEIGEIPLDWDVRRISDIASVSAGGTPSRAVSGYWNGPIPWITTSQVDYNTITKADQFISRDGLNNSAAKLLAPGALLIALYGQGKTRGKVAVLGVSAATNQACAAISLNRNVCRDFVFYYLASKYEYIRNLSNTGNQENLNGAIVKSIALPLSPLEEQRGIATALSDMDALIRALDRLIVKKRDLKLAAMQQLLTGKRRLPGFGCATTRYKNTDVGRMPEDWSAVRLGDGVSLLSGHHVLARYCNIEGVGVPYITGPADFTNGIIRCSKFTEHPATLCEPGDVLVTVKGSGAGKVVLSDDQYCISRQLMAVRANGWAGRFVYYCLLACGPQLETATTGLIPGLSRPDILERLMAIPSLPEQTAIAGVLSDMDAEIAAIERRRDKIRLLKQGMIQELLTGRIRLV